MQSTSIERFEDLKSSIKLRLPSQYPGENLELLAAQFRKDALELTTASQYDHNLTLSIMKIFLLAGGSSNEDFRFHLRATKQKLKQALLDIGFKEKTAANEHMIRLKLTYKDVCTQEEDTYRTLFDRKEWPPARNVRDSKAPPAAYGNIAIGNNSPITRAEVLNLIQSKPRFKTGQDANKKPGNCNKCGKAGHWAKECPNNKQNPNPCHQRQGGRPSSRHNNDCHARKPGWRSTPPAPGAPTTKKTDTHTFNWCATRKRWSTTHATETHTGVKNRPDGEANGPSTSAMMSLVQDPSVWTTDIDCRPTLSDIFFIVNNFPMPFKIILFLTFAPTIPDLLRFAGFIKHQLLQVHWQSIIASIATQVVQLSAVIAAFLHTYYQTFFAPLLWTVFLVAVLWNDRNFPRAKPPPAPDKLTRRQRRLLRCFAKRESLRRSRSNNHKGIRTERLHRCYPINLRAMGRFVRRSQAPTFEERRFERRLKTQIEHLKKEVENLTYRLRVQQRSQYVPGEPPKWPRQQPLPTAFEGEYRVPYPRHDRSQPDNLRQVPNLSRANPRADRVAPEHNISNSTGLPVRPDQVKSETRSMFSQAARVVQAHIRMAQVNLRLLGSTDKAAL